jgi:uncharacterized membrane protein SirB2
LTADYATIKAVHVGCAAASIALFVTRGAWMLASPEWLQRRWVKVVPHVVDTLLLASALWLAWQLGRDGIAGWVPAKVAALLVYIGLGTIALKRGRTRGIRLAAFAGAVATFGYIVVVAITKSPLGLLAPE